MDTKQQYISEYLTQGTGYRQLAAKYEIRRTTIITIVGVAFTNSFNKIRDKIN